MLKVEFYLLAATTRTALVQTLCELLEKGYKQKLRYYVHMPDKQYSHELDEALWSFKQQSFIPHQLVGEGELHPAPVLIGYDELQNIPKSQNILVNLHPEVPEYFRQFRLIIDVTPNVDEALAKARLRYKFYKSQGVELQYHDWRQVQALS